MVQIPAKQAGAEPDKLLDKVTQGQEIVIINRRKSSRFWDKKRFAKMREATGMKLSRHGFDTPRNSRLADEQP